MRRVLTRRDGTLVSIQETLQVMAEFKGMRFEELMSEATREVIEAHPEMRDLGPMDVLIRGSDMVGLCFGDLNPALDRFDWNGHVWIYEAEWDCSVETVH